MAVLNLVGGTPTIDFDHITIPMSMFQELIKMINNAFDEPLICTVHGTEISVSKNMPQDMIFLRRGEDLAAVIGLKEDSNENT